MEHREKKKNLLVLVVSLSVGGDWGSGCKNQTTVVSPRLPLVRPACSVGHDASATISRLLCSRYSCSTIENACAMAGAQSMHSSSESAVSRSYAASSPLFFPPTQHVPSSRLSTQASQRFPGSHTPSVSQSPSSLDANNEDDATLQFDEPSPLVVGGQRERQRNSNSVSANSSAPSSPPPPAAGGGMPAAASTGSLVAQSLTDPSILQRFDSTALPQPSAPAVFKGSSSSAAPPPPTRKSASAPTPAPPAAAMGTAGASRPARVKGAARTVSAQPRRRVAQPDDDDYDKSNEKDDGDSSSDERDASGNERAAASADDARADDSAKGGSKATAKVQQPTKPSTASAKLTRAPRKRKSAARSVASEAEDDVDDDSDSANGRKQTNDEDGSDMTGNSIADAKPAPAKRSPAKKKAAATKKPALAAKSKKGVAAVAAATAVDAVGSAPASSKRSRTAKTRTATTPSRAKRGKAKSDTPTEVRRKAPAKPARASVKSASSSASPSPKSKVRASKKRAHDSDDDAGEEREDGVADGANDGDDAQPKTKKGRGTSANERAWFIRCLIVLDSVFLPRAARKSAKPKKELTDEEKRRKRE